MADEGIFSYVYDSDIQLYVNSDTNTNYDTTVSQILSSSTNGIEGLPYQFLSTVDRRIPDSKNANIGLGVGRKYGDKIFSRLPLLFLTPCEPVFMDDFTKTSKTNMVQSLLSGITDSDLLNNESGKYYSVQFNYDEYYNYLNTMLGCLAVYMGLAEEEISINGANPQKLINISWQNELNPSFKSFFSCKENVIFYLDGMESVSESFSNDTTEPSLASQLNGYSDQMNELKFLFGQNGANAAATLITSASDALSATTSTLSGAAEALAGGVVGSLANKGVDSIVNGGKIMFPEIWSNSNYEKSYSIDIKLRSPDHDNLSIFLNILKPYCKLLCLVLPRTTPRSSDIDPNSYYSPFLVRACSKGLFSIDMGIITSMSVNKGAQCCWNDDGLPTQIDISIEIKDLYSHMAMSAIDLFSKNASLNPISTIKGVVCNTAYMDFLANMAGLNIAQMEIGRRITMAYYLTRYTISHKVSLTFTRFENIVSNLALKLYNLL